MGGHISLRVGVEVVKVYTRPSVSICSSASNSQLLQHCAMHAATENNGPSKRVRKPLIICLPSLTKVVMVMVSPHSNKQ